MNWQEFEQNLSILSFDRDISFWWRDDDAVEMTMSLEKLINLSENYKTPCHLAVIPEIVSKIDLSNHQYVLHHGIEHKNNALPHQKKIEIGGDLSKKYFRQKITDHKKKLEELFGASYYPCFVPPWNRIEEKYLSLIEEVGFKALSVHRDVIFSNRNFYQLNTHIDIIDWKNNKKTHDDAYLLSMIIEDIRSGENPVGFLTHHLDHCDKSWSFLEKLFHVTQKNSSIKWITLNSIAEEL